MNAEMIGMYNAVLSPRDHNDVEKTEKFFNNQIKNNPEFCKVCFQIFFDKASKLVYKKLSLILIKNTVKQNFDFFNQECHKLLHSSIINSDNKEIFSLQSEILYQIALHFPTIFDNICAYLTLYQSQLKYLPFCLYLYISIYQNEEIFQIYADILLQINKDIILKGLESPDIENQIMSIYILVNTTKKFDNEALFEGFQDLLNLTLKIVENSIKMPENIFIQIWSKLTNLNEIVAGPFLEVSNEFLNLDKITPYMRSKLYHFILSNPSYIKVEDIEPIVNDYFMTQLKVEDVDRTCQVFLCMQEVDLEASYAVFKEKILELIDSGIKRIQSIGLIELQCFTTSYPQKIINDFSLFFELTLSVVDDSLEMLVSVTDFLLEFLKNNDNFEEEDESKVFSLINQILLNQIPPEIQFKSLTISQNLGGNPTQFNNLVECFEQVQIQTLPLYLSTLLYSFSSKCDLTNVKYDKFLDFLIELYQQSLKRGNELDTIIENSLEDQDILQEYYLSGLICGSSANLIWLFSYYNPTKLSELVDPVIKTFIAMISNKRLDYLMDLDKYCVYNLDCVFEDFTYIYDFVKKSAINLIRPYYKEICESEANIDELKKIILSQDLHKFPFLEESTEEFNQLYNDFVTNKTITTIDDLVQPFASILFPMSEWVHTVDSKEAFAECVMKINYKYGKNSPQIFKWCMNILETVVKRAKTVSNESNAKLIEYINESVIKSVTEFFPRVIPFVFNQSFDALVSMMMIFIHSGNEYGHIFVEDQIFKFYSNDQISTESSIYYLFTNMIKYNFHNDEEIDKMMEIIAYTVGREDTYSDALFKFLVKLTKFDSKYTIEHFEYGLRIFNEIKDNEHYSDVKAYSALFLLTLYNIDQEKYVIVVDLIPEILSVFPSRRIMNQFYEELRSFINFNKSNLSEKTVMALITAFARYLSYQDFASFIFKLEEKFHTDLVQTFMGIVNMYLDQCPDEKLVELIEMILPEQPTSVQYILKLFS